MELSIVTTLYRSSPYLEEFYRRMSAEAQKITFDYEIIFVNDGSPDDSLQKVLSLHAADPKVRVIDLSRNFGHHKAVMTGLSYAKGEKVFIINNDLEEVPEDLPAFNKALTENPDCDVVYGVHPQRKGNLIRRSAGNFFYAVLNRLSRTRFNNDMVFSRLMTRRYVMSLLRFRESELFLVGVWDLTGYNQIPLEIGSHFKGRSSYTLRKKVAMAINAVTSFSDKPLVYISYLGVALSGLSGFYILMLFIKKLFFSDPILGWTSVIVSIWFVGGLLLFSMGLVGIYIAKIFVETKNRPYSIVKAEYPSPAADTSADFPERQHHE